MLQLDSTFNEKAYGANSFTDFVERLQKADYVEVTGGEGRYMIRMKGGGAPEKARRQARRGHPAVARHSGNTQARRRFGSTPTNSSNGSSRNVPTSSPANTGSRSSASY
jgi:hypothetical protein